MSPLDLVVKGSVALPYCVSHKLFKILEKLCIDENSGTTNFSLMTPYSVSYHNLSKTSQFYLFLNPCSALLLPSPILIISSLHLFYLSTFSLLHLLPVLSSPSFFCVLPFPFIFLCTPSLQSCHFSLVGWKLDDLFCFKIYYQWPFVIMNPLPN